MALIITPNSPYQKNYPLRFFEEKRELFLFFGEASRDHKYLDCSTSIEAGVKMAINFAKASETGWTYCRMRYHTPLKNYKAISMMIFAQRNIVKLYPVYTSSMHNDVDMSSIFYNLRTYHEKLTQEARRYGYEDGNVDNARLEQFEAIVIDFNEQSRHKAWHEVITQARNLLFIPQSVLDQLIQQRNEFALKYLYDPTKGNNNKEGGKKQRRQQQKQTSEPTLVNEQGQALLFS